MSNLKTDIDGVCGFTAAGIHAGLKANGALDMALILSDEACTAAGVFTRNRVKAAPVLVNMEHLQSHASQMRAVAVNTVSANAGTGAQGMANSRQMAQMVAQRIGCEPEQIFVMSTGVIGSPLPMDKIESGIATSHAALAQDWREAAAAIMTTDTHPKLASITVETDNGAYTVAGITKGSGMIAPNMATMLGILVTDASITPELAQRSLKQAADESYNCIVVDGDTSTNDMVVLMANGQSGVTIESDTDLAAFNAALTEVSQYLAQAVVRDGEGVTKFITVRVVGAATDADAAQIAHTVAASPLVKTAFYGNDANVGRIVAAAGRAGVDFDANCLSLWMATGSDLPAEAKGLRLFQDGAKARYDETEATAIISESEITITLDLCQGDGQATVWTCDLSHEYVSINADYRT